MAIRITKKPKIKIASIEEAITRLIHRKSFYATVIAGITRRSVPKFICETMAVVCNPETYLGIELIYNQEFINGIEDMDFFEFVVEHECVHLILEHIQRFWTDKRMKKVGHDTFNIGADMAVNDQIIKHYPTVKKEIAKSFWLPEKKNLPSDRSMEIYSLLIDTQRKKEAGCPMAGQVGGGSGGGGGSQPGQGGSGGSGGTAPGGKCPQCGGTHEEQFGQGAVNPHLWGFKIVEDENGNKKLVPVGQKEMEGSATKQELNLPDYIQQCVDSYTKDCGSLPGYVQDMIKDFIRLNKGISWQEVLYSKVASGMPCKRKPSIMRSSRRLWGAKSLFPKVHPFPGKATERAYKVCLIMDTSGSMSQRDLQAAASTLKSLMDFYKNVRVWVVHADTSVHKVQELSDISEFDFNVYGRGGTDFIQPINQVEEDIEPDIILYFTDGYGRAPEKSPKASIVWFISKGGMDPTAHMGTPYGEVVYVDYN
jgi:predicted metal-dependent peptidase